MGNRALSLPRVPKVGAAVSADEILQLEARVAKAVCSIDDIETLQEWRAQAAALEAYLRGTELQRPILGAERRVEARIGQLLGKSKRGERTDLQPPTRESEVRQQRDGHDASDFRILAHAFRALKDDDEWRRSRRALVSFLRQKLGLRPPVPALPQGEFRCICADPPWELTTGPEVFGGREAGNEPLAYEQMSVEEIKALPVEKAAAEHCHLYLWTTNRYVEPAYEIARAWGFKPSVLLVWAKTPRGVGLGGTFKLTTEFILYARRGVLEERSVVNTSWFNWPRGRHSEKPAAFYEMVETVNHAPYLEMFAREAREGWTVWGEEVGLLIDGGGNEALRQPAS